MSLGHWCFALFHVHSFLTSLSWNMSPCRVFLLKSFKLKHLNWSSSPTVFSASQASTVSWLTDHWRTLLPWSLKRTMATVNASAAGSNTGSGWRTEQHSAVTDKVLSDFPLQRNTLLMANTLRVNQLSFETVAPMESLSETPPELEAFEAQDLLTTTQAITAVRSNCEELKNTAVSTAWVATCHTDPRQHERWTLWTEVHHTHSRVTMQLFQPCSIAFSSLWKPASYEDGWDTVPQLFDATLQLHSCRVQLLHQSHTGDCGNPHWCTVQSWRSQRCADCTVHALLLHGALRVRSWKLVWSRLHCLPMNNWTAGSPQGVHCWEHCRCIGLASTLRWTRGWLYCVITLHCTASWQAPLFINWQPTSLTRPAQWRHWLHSTGST